RLGHQFVVDDVLPGVAYMFGGSGFGAAGLPGALQDLWSLVINDNGFANWTFVGGSTVAGYDGTSSLGHYGTMGVESPTNQPGSRQDSAMVVWNRCLWIYGGQGYASNNNTRMSPLGDLWKFNLTTRAWTWVSGYSTAGTGMEIGLYPSMPGTFNGTLQIPGARYAPIMTVDSVGNIWLSQGNGLASVANQTGDLDDLWEYTASTTRLWTSWYGSPFVNESLPGLPGDRRYSSATVAIDDVWYAYGGNAVIGPNSQTGILGDLWQWNFLVDRCASQNV